jgi:hypothetical protein
LPLERKDLALNRIAVIASVSEAIQIASATTVRIASSRCSLQ